MKNKMLELTKYLTHIGQDVATTVEKYYLSANAIAELVIYKDSILIATTEENSEITLNKTDETISFLREHLEFIEPKKEIEK